MKNRFRILSDGQLIGLYLHMNALEQGKTSVFLSNKCLGALVHLSTIHDKRIRQLAASFSPFLGKCKIHTHLGHSKTATFLLPGQAAENNSFCPSALPALEDMEKALGLNIREIETERRNVILVNNANFSV